METRSDRLGTRPNRILAIVVGAISVVAVAAVAFAAMRPAKEFDRSTPEGTVQAYVTAVLKGDHDAAARLLAADSPCDAADLDRASFAESARVSLVDTEVDGDKALVTVDVTFTAGGGPFDTFEQSDKQVFRLARSGQDWRLSGIPWPLFDCGGSTG